MAIKKINKQRDELQGALLDDEDFLKVMVEKVCQRIMEEEMTEFIGADPHERTDDRKGYRNGFKPRILRTRVGELNLLVPKDREGRFSSSLFNRYQRNEKALVLALQQMYLQGVSTRKVKEITEALCGLEFSKSLVSELAKELDLEILALPKKFCKNIFKLQLLLSLINKLINKLKQKDSKSKVILITTRIF
jgi:transposase-like protein